MAIIQYTISYLLPQAYIGVRMPSTLLPERYYYSLIFPILTYKSNTLLPFISCLYLSLVFNFPYIKLGDFSAAIFQYSRVFQLFNIFSYLYLYISQSSGKVSRPPQYLAQSLQGLFSGGGSLLYYLCLRFTIALLTRSQICYLSLGYLSVFPGLQVVIRQRFSGGTTALVFSILKGVLLKAPIIMHRQSLQITLSFLANPFAFILVSPIQCYTYAL